MYKIFSKVILACIVIALASGCDIFSRPRQGRKINGRWEGSNNIFKVRVTAYAEEGGGFVAGAYYIFESAAVGSDNWREVMTVRHDDPVEIPREQVRFVSDQIGYAFMLYKYAVTTDGGTTWSVWDATRDLPYWQRTRAAIKEVRLVSDGTGMMSLTSFTNEEAPELYTEDYGLHWAAE